MGVVEDAVEDGVGDGLIGQVLVPLLGRQLAGHDGGSLAVAVLENLEQVTALLIAWGMQAPIVDHEFVVARADGSYARFLARLARTDILVIDDWGLTPSRDPERQELLEILEDRYGSRSTIITSQIPPNRWHDHLGDATMADAILDRLLHNSHKVVLKGPSRRKGKEDSTGN